MKFFGLVSILFFLLNAGLAFASFPSDQNATISNLLNGTYTSDIGYGINFNGYYFDTNMKQYLGNDHDDCTATVQVKIEEKSVRIRRGPINCPKNEGRYDGLEKSQHRPGMHVKLERNEALLYYKGQNVGNIWKNGLQAFIPSGVNHLGANLTRAIIIEQAGNIESDGSSERLEYTESFPFFGEKTTTSGLDNYESINGLFGRQ